MDGLNKKWKLNQGMKCRQRWYLPFLFSLLCFYYLSTCPPLFFRPSICLSTIYLFVQLVCPSIHASILPSIHPSIHPSTYPHMYSFICLFTHSFHSSICLSFHSSMYLYEKAQRLEKNFGFVICNNTCNIASGVADIILSELNWNILNMYL